MKAVFVLVILILYYSVGVVNAQPSAIDLTKQKFQWKPIYLNLSHTSDSLVMHVKTNNRNEIFNRAELATQLNATGRPLILDLNYSSNSMTGKALFYVEIRENKLYNIALSSFFIGTHILWSTPLHDTHGLFTNETHTLPISVENKPIVLRLYVITFGAGEHTLIVKNASVI